MMRRTRIGFRGVSKPVLAVVVVCLLAMILLRVKALGGPASSGSRAAQAHGQVNVEAHDAANR